jgi:hypothetical protein
MNIPNWDKTILDNGLELFSSPEGDKFYYKNDKFHREDGPAIQYVDSGEEWHYEGKAHRIGGPAITRITHDKDCYIRSSTKNCNCSPNMTKEWWVHDKLHREDGPAVEYHSHGIIWQDLWCYDGTIVICSSLEEFQKRIKMKAFW